MSTGASLAYHEYAPVAYLDALELPAEPIREYRVGARCVYPQMDWASCRELHVTEKLPWRTCVRDWILSEKPIFDWDDPLPALWNAAALLPVALGKVAPRVPSPTRSLLQKVWARLALVPEAFHVRRTAGRGLLAQCRDLFDVCLGGARLRAAEYYDYRLYDPRYDKDDRRAFAFSPGRSGRS